MSEGAAPAAERRRSPEPAAAQPASAIAPAGVVFGGLSFPIRSGLLCGGDDPRRQLRRLPARHREQTVLSLQRALGNRATTRLFSNPTRAPVSLLIRRSPPNQANAPGAAPARTGAAGGDSEAVARLREVIDAARTEAELNDLLTSLQQAGLRGAADHTPTHVALNLPPPRTPIAHFPFGQLTAMEQRIEDRRSEIRLGLPPASQTPPYWAAQRARIQARLDAIRADERLRDFLNDVEHARPMGGTQPSSSVFVRGRNGEQLRVDLAQLPALRTGVLRELRLSCEMLRNRVDSLAEAVDHYEGTSINPNLGPQLAPAERRRRGIGRDVLPIVPEQDLDAVHRRLRSVEAAIQGAENEAAAGRFGAAYNELMGGTTAFNHVSRDFYEGIERSNRFAEAQQWALEFVRDASVAVFGALATAATGGAAAAIATGIYGAEVAAAGQASEIRHGLRTSFDPTEIVLNAVASTAGNLLGAQLAPQATRVLVRELSLVLREAAVSRGVRVTVLQQAVPRFVAVVFGRLQAVAQSWTVGRIQGRSDDDIARALTAQQLDLRTLLLDVLGQVPVARAAAPATPTPPARGGRGPVIAGPADEEPHAATGRPAESAPASGGASAGGQGEVNPGFGRVPLRDTNCFNVAIANDARRGGRPATALPGAAVDMQEGLRELEAVYRGPIYFGSFSTLTTVLRQAGPGARAIVAGRYVDGPDGHAFNAYNEGNTIHFEDAQSHAPIDQRRFRDLHYILTHFADEEGMGSPFPGGRPPAAPTGAAPGHGGITVTGPHAATGTPGANPAADFGPGDVNPGFGRMPLRDRNCVNVAIANDARLGRRPATALPGAAVDQHEAMRELQRLYRGPVEPGTFESIANELRQAGPGARAIVLAQNVGANHGHAFNAVNENGGVRFEDAQTNMPIDQSRYRDLHYIRTEHVDTEGMGSPHPGGRPPGAAGAAAEPGEATRTGSRGTIAGPSFRELNTIRTRLASQAENAIRSAVPEIEQVIRRDSRLAQAPEGILIVEIGFRGSLATAMRNAQNYGPGAAFNPNDFDVDALIVSDQLYNWAPDQGRGRWGRTIGLGGVEQMLLTTLQGLPGFAGMRQSFGIRLWRRADLGMGSQQIGPHRTIVNNVRIRAQ